MATETKLLLTINQQHQIERQQKQHDEYFFAPNFHIEHELVHHQQVETRYLHLWN